MSWNASTTAQHLPIVYNDHAYCLSYTRLQLLSTVTMPSIAYNCTCLLLFTMIMPCLALPLCRHMVVCAMLDRSMLVHHQLLTDAKDDLRALEVSGGGCVTHVVNV
jgi:hypothetical protein